MLQRRTADNGVVYYASSLLESAGIPHAFSTRLGGVSSGPFASLNLGNPGGCAEQDSAANIQENYLRLQEAARCAGRRRRWVHQVHGCEIHESRRGGGFENGARGDALVGDDPAEVLAMRTADCAPILLAGDDGKMVAAVHAGWRGTVAGVVGATVKRLTELSRREPRRLLAAIGPCISREAFEVGPEVVVEFEAALGARAPVVRGKGDRAYIDLRRALHLQLLDAGLADSSIDVSDRCTSGHADEFFSHRRDRGITGRMAALIGVKEEGQIA